MNTCYSNFNIMRIELLSKQKRFSKKRLSSILLVINYAFLKNNHFEFQKNFSFAAQLNQKFDFAHVAITYFIWGSIL